MEDLRNQKFLGIQALRMLAAFLVVCTHSTFYTHERLDKAQFVWLQGTRGVDIFFVISGFVMIYASRKLIASPGGWRKFAISRIVRIVPLYWLVTTLKVLALLVAAGIVLHAKLHFVNVLCSYLFLPAMNGDGKIDPLVNVGWTLNLEMLFYVLFTLALFLRANVFKFVGVILALLSIGAYFRQPSWPAAAFYLNSMVLEFFFGMMIAKVCLRGTYCPRKASVWLLACGFALLLLPPLEWNLPKAVISGLPACLMVWSAASLGSMESFVPRFVLYLGDASYSIYLIHPFIAPLAPTLLRRMHMVNPEISVVLGVAFGLVLGCILYQFIELPMTRWLKGYLAARHGTPAETVACHEAPSVIAQVPGKAMAASSSR